MSTRVVLIVGVVIALVLAARLTMPAVWWAVGRLRVWRAGPGPLHASAHRIWRDPGTVTALDAIYGPGPAGSGPHPPFRFLEEHTTGSQPTVSVRDGRGRVWRVKWGPEVRCETFAVRLASSCGYFAEETHFVAAGTISGAATLQRARECIDERDGTFLDARFELDDPAVNKLFEEHSWAWNDNPFVGTRELNGLKIVVMLLSNWDTKDRRDVARGSNTAIFEHRLADGHREARYLLTDWGGSMGRWGGSAATRGRWDADGFTEQTPGFVTGVADGCVTFGYAGQRTADVAEGIPLEHVQWFSRYLEPLTDDYLSRALRVSGASAEETPRFVAALRDRIGQITAVARAEAHVEADLQVRLTSRPVGAQPRVFRPASQSALTRRLEVAAADPLARKHGRFRTNRAGSPFARVRLRPPRRSRVRTCPRNNSGDGSGTSAKPEG